MNARPVQRYLGLAFIVATAAFATAGYFSIRRDVENLRVISQDNILWTATQMEVELLRFKLSVAKLDLEGTPEAVEEVRARFDILWSRIFMLGSGRVGQLIRRYDEGHEAIPALQRYLTALDPTILRLTADDHAAAARILGELESFQHSLRLYTLRVVRGDTAATAAVRDRIQFSSLVTMGVSLAAVLLSLAALALLLRDNRRQRQMAELNRRIAVDADRASRAKSRFLTMMSHELRNPLNGVLGPLALLGETNLGMRQERLVRQAQQSGKSMVQMLAGLLDYGAMQDGRLAIRTEPFRVTALAAGVRDYLEGVGAGGVRVTVDPATPELLHGDAERLQHIFAHLAEFVLEGSDPAHVEISFGYSAGELVGEIALAGGEPAMEWKLDLMMGINEFAPQQLSTEALRPMIARGLINASQGFLSAVKEQSGRRAIRVLVPAAEVRYDRIRVRLETRSAALAAIYRAALRSDRIVFTDADDLGVDMVLVDATSVSEQAAMARLRARFTDALFVSLGPPADAERFDEVVDGPADMSRLRSSILARLAG